MFEFYYDVLTDAQMEAYLERIGCAMPTALTKETLDHLIYQHQCSVPFEAMDVFCGAADVPLDGASLYSKIVERKRGGFCYELNGLFVLLLRKLGFDAYSCMCRVAANRTDLGNLFHRATLVRLDGKLFLCDVGLGGPMAPFAVEVSTQRQTQMGETFWIEPTYEGWYLQKRLASDGSEASVIIFAPQPFLANDFVAYCRMLINAPGSSFRTVRQANLRTANGNINLRNNTLTITENGAHQETQLEDAQIPQVLKEHFGIVL